MYDSLIIMTKELEGRFKEVMKSKEKSLESQTRAFEEHTLFMERKIKNHFTSFSIFAICGSERNKFMVDSYF